jgi:hypothetical protein
VKRDTYICAERLQPNLVWIPWDEEEPGHFEVDLVHHCGSSTTGEYMGTIQMIDVATGWSERVAVLGRSLRLQAATW